MRHLRTPAAGTFFFTIAVFLLLSFSDPYAIKRITDGNFRYEFYVTDKQVSPKGEKTYYWFKGGKIHSTQSGLTGSILNGPYIKMYLSNQLAEQGNFKKGLKDGLWKTWYPNGTLETTQQWHNGIKKGKYYYYSNSGELIQKGTFKKNLKQGQWIDGATNDTVRYKKGIIFVEKPKLSKAEKATLKAARKKDRLDKKAAGEVQKATKESQKQTGSNPEAAKKNSGKVPFFKRIFSKKNNGKSTNGQGS